MPALLAIGAYASALLALDLRLPVGPAILAAGVITALLGTLLVFPSFRLRGHYVSIATLGVGEIVDAGDSQLGQPDARADRPRRPSRRCPCSAWPLLERHVGSTDRAWRR